MLIAIGTCTAATAKFCDAKHSVHMSARMVLTVSSFMTISRPQL